MVQYEEITRAVIGKIKEIFPDALIYADEVKEGYKKPSFFIGILPVSSTNYTQNIIEEQLIITISYFSDTSESLKNLQVMQKLRVAVGNGVGVVNRFFTISQIETQKVEGDIYQMIFSIDYYEQTYAKPNDSMVKEIIYK